MDRADNRELRAFIAGNGTEFESVEEAQEYLNLVEAAEQKGRELRWADEEQEAYRRSPEAKVDEHRRRADEVASVRRKFEHSAAGYRHAAAKVVRGREAEHLGADEFRGFCQAADRLIADATRADKLEKLEKRERRAAQASVVAEPGPYDKGSPNSWVRDVLVARAPELRGFVVDRSGISDMSEAAVADRLAKHGHGVSRAVLTRSKYGRRVERILSEQHRCEDPDLHARKAREEVRSVRLAEIRAFGTGGGVTASASGGGAAFVAPAFLMDAWAQYRSPYRSFADQLDPSVPLPAFGLEAYLPIVTTGTTVSTQTELSGVSEGDPVTGFSASAIVMKAGQIAVTEQFLDRAGPGIAGDAVLFTQLKNQLGAQVDAYAIAQSLAGALSVTNSGSFALANATAGVGGFLGDLKKAKSKLTDQAGTRIRGTHCFALDDFVDYIGAYSDGNARPVFSPELDDNRLPIRSQGDMMAEGYSGYVLGGLALFGDSNIPNSGSGNIQVIVTRADTILLLEGDPIPYCYPPSFAGNLTAVLGVREYVGAIPRWPSGVSVISGAAYAASTFA